MRHSELVQLHARHKLELLARSPQAYRELGRLVADGVDPDVYRARLAEALSEEPTRGRTANALRHAAGYLPQPECGEAGALIDAYERGEIELERPRGAVRAAAERHGASYLLEQTLLRR